MAINGFTCGRGIRVTGRGLVVRQIYLYESEVCLRPDICGLPLLCPSHIFRMWCNLFAVERRCQVQAGVCQTTRAGQRMPHWGCKLRAPESSRDSSWSPHSAPGLVDPLRSVVLSLCRAGGGTARVGLTRLDQWIRAQVLSRCQCKQRQLLQQGRDSARMFVWLFEDSRVKQ